MPYYSNVAWNVRSLRSWQKCHDYFNGTAKPRTWEENERPLRNNRQWHYRLERDGTTYKCMLYRTAVVTWMSDEEFILDVRYDSMMTRNFFPNFMPHNTPGYLHIKFGKRTLLWKGMYYDTEKPFRFNMRGDNWELISSHDLITRQVLDKEKVKELKPLLTPFAQYVKGLWGIAGGENPYTGDEVEGYPNAAETYQALVREDYATVIKLNMPYYFDQYVRKYAECSGDILIRKIRKKMYNYAAAYVWKPYNER